MLYVICLNDYVMLMEIFSSLILILLVLIVWFCPYEVAIDDEEF